MTTSFAWGLAPAEARTQSKSGVCNVSDQDWTNSVSLCTSSQDVDTDLVSSCTIEASELQVPRLLISDLIVSVAMCLLANTGGVLKAPRFTIRKTYVSPGNPPKGWLVTLIACFPCDGTPTTRCAHMTVILDAAHVERSRVLSATDAGVVPAEQTLMDGVLPYNALSAELIVKR